MTLRREVFHDDLTPAPELMASDAAFASPRSTARGACSLHFERTAWGSARKLPANRLMGECRGLGCARMLIVR
jgi:hypothetical protein